MIVQKCVNNIVTLVIDRPEKANALNEEMLVRLAQELDAAANSPARAVILTGRGKVYSAGADLDEAREGLIGSESWARLSARMATMPCLTIAAINGTMAGGAFGVTIAADLRIAVPEAEMFYPVMRLGYLPPDGDARRLASLVGPARAKMLLMAGQKISARDALGWGLVDRLTPRDQLIDDAIGLAKDVVSASPDNVMAIKAMIA
ncbi:enoyl-CoA hydratase/isomerase family protein [Paracoccus sediminicola]|uniref:enoyl-CoA hydratase/isomerase family protein n=1 Tax=Paracoccus sediminicola TaxID=3017783 RepID=UPI0022F13E00|nr:enoyl-CoA hydratase/isomerase family protein [Paracoccus sediminicola]WBU56340.1 enoyl-CoA hydratase/isomerase family protein [Paracoccus sediminicola]